MKKKKGYLEEKALSKVVTSECDLRLPHPVPITAIKKWIQYTRQIHHLAITMHIIIAQIQIYGNMASL